MNNIEITVDEITQDISIAVDPVGIQGEQGDKGDKGDKGNPFTFSDFTPEQIESLKIKGDKGDAFTYSDFTPEQIEGLKVKGDKGDEGEKGDKGEPFTFEDLTHAQKAAAFNTFFANYYDPAIVSLSARGTTFHRNLHQVQHELDKLEHKPTIYTDMSVTSEGKLHSVIPSDGSGDWTVERNCEASFIDKDRVMKFAPPNTPRIDWSTGEPMLLVEEEGTNFIRYSEDFSNSWWLKTDALLEANSRIAPDGTLTAYKYIKQGLGNNIIWRSGSGLTLKPNTQYTFSCWYVSDTPGTTQMSVYGVDSGGSVGSIRKIIELNQDWRKFEITAISEASGNLNVYIVDERGASATLDSLYIWGAQLEEGSRATSHIPTNGSTVTRLADNIYKENAQDFVGQNEGTLYTEFIFRKHQGSSQFILSVGNTYPNSITITNSSSGSLMALFRREGVHSHSIISSTYLVDGGRYKLALKYKSGDVKLFLNGQLVASNVYLLDLQTPQIIKIGSRVEKDNPSYSSNSLYKSINSYKQALSDEQLIALTTL